MSNSIPLMEMGEGSGDYVDPFAAKQAQKRARRRRAGCQVHYEFVFWVVFLALTIWCILDRFFVNLYPMTINFKPLTATIWKLNGGYVHPAVTIFDGYGRATGRLFLTVMNALFWTQCKTTENFLMEHHPKWINMGDVRTVNNRTHYILGMFFMAIPMVIHVLLTFIPALAGVEHNLLNIAPVRSGRTKMLAKLVSPFIRRGIGNRAAMFVTQDDIYRAALMIALYCIMFPFSISNAARKRWFSMTQWLHIVAAATFTIDMIRRSPHAQVFSPVVVFFFLVDRIAGLFLYRTGEASIIHSEALDQEYTIIFLYVPRQKRRRLLGSGYYFGFPGLEGAFEISHPYVCFQNHTGEPLLPEWKNHDAESTKHKFYVERTPDKRKSFQKRPDHAPKPIDSDEEDQEDSIISQETDDVIFFSNWTTAVLVQVHKWNRGSDSFSWRWSQKEIASKIRFWGPYLSEYAFCTPDGRDLPPLVLIGTGTGAGFIIDFYMFFTANGVELTKPVTVYFSTNSIGLFQFLTDLTCDKPVPNWHVNAHLTKADDFEVDFEDEDEKPGEHDKHASRRDMKLGRLSFMDVLSDAPADAVVYFNGAPALAWKVQGACATFGLTFRPGHRFASDGIRSCKRTGKCSFTCQCNKFPCCLVY